MVSFTFVSGKKEKDKKANMLHLDHFFAIKVTKNIHIGYQMQEKFTHRNSSLGSYRNPKFQ